MKKSTLLRALFWRRHPDLTPLCGTGACLCMPVAGIRLRRTGSSLGVTPHKRKNTPAGCSFLLEAPPGLEPGVRDLQSRALPLGYGAGYEICGRGGVRKSFCWSGLRGSNSLPPPWQGGALPDELKPQMVPQARVPWQGGALPDELKPQMVPQARVELATRGFSVRCSTY